MSGPWVKGWCSPCPLQCPPSQPCGRHQARHDEVPRGPQSPGPGPALRGLPRSLLHPQQQLPAALQGDPGKWPRWVLPCDGHLHLSAQTPTHGGSLGFASGGIPVGGLGPTQQWGELKMSRDVCAVAQGGRPALFCRPTRCWYLDAITSGSCLPTCACALWHAQEHATWRQPTLWLMRVLLLSGHTPLGPLCPHAGRLPRAGSVLAPFPNIFCTHVPHPATPHTTHRLALDRGLLLL